MNIDWRALLFRQLALLLTACLLVGALTGAYAIALAMGLALYLAWQIRQLLRLLKWLNRADLDTEVPEAGGLWGELLDNLHRRQRRHQHRLREVQAVILRAQESTSALRDGLLVLDAQGNLDWWNPAAARLLGLRDQDVGQPLINLLRHPRFGTYFEQGKFRDPLEIPAPAHEGVQLQIEITHFGEGEHLLLVRDVTRMHRLEQMRKDFVANVSHELRTPLTVIAGYLETFQSEEAAPPPRWRRPLSQMDQQAQRMRHLLDDLLLLARLEATEYPTDSQWVPVADVLQGIRQDALALSAERGHQIDLQADESICLRGSESELRSAFSNLVFNAVKYSHPHSVIQVCWQATETGATLSVRDSSPGIEAKHLSRLTERFYRVDESRASSTGGTGLGLAIVKHVLMRHRGHLHIESTLGEGSLFTCHFPAALLSRQD